MAEPEEVLERYRTIAVVGMSTNPDKPAHNVPLELKEAGFRIIPVNPSAEEILGQRSYASLREIEEPIDVVDVFRPSEEARDVARQAVEVGAKALWLQLGIRSYEARSIAEAAGMDYVEDRCMAIERRRYDITKAGG